MGKKTKVLEDKVATLFQQMASLRIRVDKLEQSTPGFGVEDPEFTRWKEKNAKDPGKN